jgi:hypothetical protein
MGSEGQAAIDAGGLVVEVLYVGQDFVTPPTQNEMAAWIQTIPPLHVTVVRPKPGDPTLAELQSREWSYIVDLKTMQIVWTGFGSYAGLAPTSMHNALTQLHGFLGK